MRVTLVPHTHWDREWYEPFDGFLPRLVAMMDTLIELGDEGFPHFHLDGQTAMVDDYLAVRPEREPDVRRLAAEGRLSLGPWVTQMDEFLTSGESHVRNLEMGLERARELGPATEIGYLPDQFGHVGQMPQILRQAGIDRAVLWRGVPASIERTEFRWEAPDGSSVLTEYLAFGYFLGGDLHRFADPEALAGALRDKLRRIEPYLVDDRVLITVGSDHSGPDPDLPARLAAAEALLPETTIRIGALADHLGGASPDGLPVWRGELRSSARAHLLPNVVSARANQKRERGRVEALVERYAEPLAALVPGFAWPAERLRRLWTLLLWNGAHDSVCGCSHDGVAHDVDARYAEARAIAEAVADEALASLGSQTAEAGVLRFNPSPFERDGVPGLGWAVEPAAPEPSLGRRRRLGRRRPGHGRRRVRVHAPGRAGRRGPLQLLLRGSGAGTRPAGLGRRRRPRRARGAVARARGPGPRSAARRRTRLPARRDDREPPARSPAPPGALAARRSRRARSPDRPSSSSSVPSCPRAATWSRPSPTWPARHVVLAGGLAAFHEGVFEYEVAGAELLITLVRCVGTISRERLATRPWPAGPGVATPEAQMIGTTAFSIGVAASRGAGLPAPGLGAVRAPAACRAGAGRGFPSLRREPAPAGGRRGPVQRPAPDGRRRGPGVEPPVRPAGLRRLPGARSSSGRRGSRPSRSIPGVGAPVDRSRTARGVAGRPRRLARQRG